MSMQVVEPRPISPVVEFQHQLDQRSNQFRMALPGHITPERFTRVVMTAVQNNRELLDCDRRSLFNACMKAAQDGLLPDGREGAIVVRWGGKNGKQASWQPMIAGIRKKVRNSGEIATWDVHVVKQKDVFRFRLGDDPFIEHEPSLEEDPGPTIAVYSIAVLKSGEKSRDVMSIGAIRKIRDEHSDGWRAYKAGKIKSTPWATSEDEMAKKTLARRHSKVLPMSTDIDDLLRRGLDDAPHGAETPEQARPNTLTGRLDALAAMPNGDEETDDEAEFIDARTGEVITTDVQEQPDKQIDADATDAPPSQPEPESEVMPLGPENGASLQRDTPPRPGQSGQGGADPLDIPAHLDRRVRK